MVARWLFVNIVTVIIIITWSFYQGYDSSLILYSKVEAQGAFILFLINVNMYFVFLIIRKSKNRTVKIRLAKVSKKMMKYHIPIAITAFILVIVHGAMMISVNSQFISSPVILAGVCSLLILIVLLFSGLLRRRKATGKRRKFHYVMAFIFFAFLLVHIFL